MATRHRIHSTLPICGVGFQHRSFVHVKKDTSKIWVCIDFHKLNKATPKDEDPMPIADMW
jgi:hypothetical protein